MTDVPYIPHEEGPLFPDDSGALAEEAKTFLRASNRDIADAVEKRNISDMAEASGRLWIDRKLTELNNTDATKPEE